MKADIDLIQICLQRNGIDARLTAQVLSDIQEQVKLEQAERQAASEKDKQKFKKLCIVANDTDGNLLGVEIEGYVLAIPEDASEFDLKNQIAAAKNEFNHTPKGMRCPVNSLREVIEAIPQKIAKNNGFSIKTREQTYILTIYEK